MIDVGADVHKRTPRYRQTSGSWPDLILAKIPSEASAGNLGQVRTIVLAKPVVAWRR
jgi:hypothetical protein